jgi:hypothetical protein
VTRAPFLQAFLLKPPSSPPNLGNSSSESGRAWFCSVALRKLLQWGMWGWEEQSHDERDNTHLCAGLLGELLVLPTSLKLIFWPAVLPTRNGSSKLTAHS